MGTSRPKSRAGGRIPISGKRVIDLRTHMGWSQSELSKQTGVGERTIQDWETLKEPSANAKQYSKLLRAVSIADVRQLDRRYESDWLTFNTLLTGCSSGEYSHVRATSPTTQFTVRWYTFIPFACGSGTQPPSLYLISHEEHYQGYRTRIDDVRLRVYTNIGVGVWVVARTRTYASIIDFAQDRVCYYNALLHSGDHHCESKQYITSYMREFQGNQKFLYAMSMVVVEHLGWVSERVDTALKLLSCPSIALGYSMRAESSDISISSKTAVIPNGLEIAAFSHDFSSGEFHPICVPNVMRGYASWSGVAVHFCQPHAVSLLDSFVSYQSVLQSLWYFAHQVSSSDSLSLLEQLKPDQNVPLWHLQQVSGPSPTETAPVRVFKEASFLTSRIEQVLRKAKITL